MELTYTMVGDYYIPDLSLGEQPNKPLGKYGRMHQQYLKSANINLLFLDPIQSLVAQQFQRISS